MIARGDKRIETRPWPTSHRGDLLICSTKKPEYPGLPLGKAVCMVQVIACRQMTTADEKQACCPVYPGAWSWILTDIREIDTPFAVKGRQGFFEVDVPNPPKTLFNGQ